MRIDSATIGMESARSYQSSATQTRRFMITEYREAFAQDQNALYASVSEENTNEDPDGAVENEKEKEGVNPRIAMFEDWKRRFDISNSTSREQDSRSDFVNELRQFTIRYIFDMLFAARRGRLKSRMEENGLTDSGYGGQSGQSLLQQNAPEQSAMNQQAQGILITKKLNFVQEDHYQETENTSFSTVGTVRTGDGREIQFNVHVNMSRSFEQYAKEELEINSFTMCDPLVINLDTDVASLEDQTFYFDLDADGEEEKIAGLAQGSGYLALDHNEDGMINDGSELFGTESGNGFADLAKYDLDGNGWIDEADAVWSRLKIWCRGEDGKDVLYTLGEKGVGAICLQNTATDFNLKASDGRQTLGAIRNSGVFLYENGTVGTIQHVDVAKYSREA